ncbi:MAG TPA: hypothetical protein VFD55_01935 [Candidatus Angelobacter sp.]|nr:hypothetical protein [Candidatus Angelobacter sp.]
MATIKIQSSHHQNTPKFKSFKVHKNVKPFVQFRVTEQTVYWSVLLIFILMLALWILSIQLNIDETINNIRL